MSGPWVWNDKAKRYRDTTTGRFISHHKAITLRDFYIEAKKGDMDKLSRRLINKDVSLPQWTLEMRSQVKDTFINEYMLARGGRNNMTQADWGRVGAMLKKQYGYIDNFGADIKAEKVSEGQMRTRARMYISSGTQAFERARAESVGAPVLPAYPGDSSTRCHSNCGCSWSIEEKENHWEAYWRLGPHEHCEDCLERSVEWAPYVVYK